jgi:hypothetical protein
MLPPDALGSPTRAAGFPPIRTVVDPMTTASTPQVSPMVAAGTDPIITVGVPGGTSGVGAPLVAVLMIMSPILAAGGIMNSVDVSLLMRGFQLIFTIPPLSSAVALPSALSEADAESAS